MKLYCAACGGECRIVSLTDAGASYACPCGRTTWTQSTEGKLDLGLKASGEIDVQR